MINCFLRNLFNSILSYFSHGLICPDTLVGDYNKVYIKKNLSYTGFGGCNSKYYKLVTVCKLVNKILDDQTKHNMHDALRNKS